MNIEIDKERSWLEYVSQSFESKEQRQQREYKETLAKKDKEYKELCRKKEEEKKIAQINGEQAGFVKVAFHSGSINSVGSGRSNLYVWNCCSSKLVDTPGSGCEEKWVPPEVHRNELCPSGCSIHQFKWEGTWISPEQWNFKCRGGFITPLGQTVCVFK